MSLSDTTYAKTLTPFGVDKQNAKNAYF